MPRTQALAFAIRTRPNNGISRIRRLGRQTQQLQSLAQTLTRNHTTKCPVSSSKSSLSQQLSALKPSSLRLTILRRHVSSLTGRTRPQSSFLSVPYHDKSFGARFDRFLRNRYLTTARKKKWKQQFKYQLRFQLTVWPLFLAFYTMWYGIDQIQLEHEFPTPSEWSFWARWDGRTGRTLLEQVERRGYARAGEWATAASYYLDLLNRLEPGKGAKKDARGILVQEEVKGAGPIFVDGLGQVGYDISAKSERWKQGYWEALMALGKISENLDGLCKKKGHDLTEKERLYKWENIPGPNNPRPVPMEWQKDGSHQHPPTFTDVESAIDPPESFYLKILTSRGFTNRQRLDTALAYADWCDFKGLHDTAANMYDWALDIAAGGLPEGAGYVVDIQTGVINSGKERFVSENLLKATTALGVWHARRGEVKEALPIFLSVLRARKSLPAAPAQFRASNSQNVKTAAEAQSKSTTEGVLSFFWNFVDFFRESDDSYLKSNGDEQPYHSLQEACEEVGIMTYIGEILFATSEHEREKGLSWTRDSVGAAEAILWLMEEQTGTKEEEAGKQKCKECLQTGLSNWQQMTRQMARLAVQKEQDAKENKGWLGLGIGQASAIEKATQEVQRWQEETDQIELRRQKVVSLLSALKSKDSSMSMLSAV